VTETDGNLGAQLRKLEKADYLAATKAFVERKRATHYAITKAGHTRLKAHLDALSGLIKTANGAANGAPK
jgi:DNA-binding PadR family transcriptional regulator